VKDLTILYITASEVPEKWLAFQLAHLENAANGAPIISISRKPMKLGYNLIDEEPKSYWNIYMQMLRGALIAETPYVAMAEDDTLYTKEHFYSFRPELNEVAYDRSRWSLFTWDNVYCVRQRISNCSLVASREYLIECLTERKNTFPNGLPNRMVGEVGRSKIEHRMGITVRNMVEWYSRGPIVQLNHPTGTDNGDYQNEGGRRMIKKHGQIQAYDIPYWGKATDILSFYKVTHAE
jgi:hypothetical protein